MSSSNQPPQPKIHWERSADYSEGYANSLQIRWSLWDFFVMFGTTEQVSQDTLAIKFFKGVYLSPQQAKALLIMMQQNVAQYENAFGEIKLEPKMVPQPGQNPIH